MAKKKLDTPRSFAHDSNARNSSNIIKLRLAHGAAGYGVYFMLLERLRDSSDYKARTDYTVLAYDLRESVELIKSVIEDFGLFELSDDGATFHSATLTARMTAQFRSKEEPVAAPSVPSEPSESSEISENSENSEPSEPVVDPCDFDYLLSQVANDHAWIRAFALTYEHSEEKVRNCLLTEFRDHAKAKYLRIFDVDTLKAEFKKWY